MLHELFDASRVRRDALALPVRALHERGLALVISMKPTLALAGDYWTGRKTRGRITTSGHTKQCLRQYVSASNATFS